MRMSRVLLAGVAVAGAVATTSAFTAGNTFNAGALADDNAGYGELAVTGVTVSNIAYTPLAADPSKLDNIIFTVTEDSSNMDAFMVLSGASGVLAGSTSTCAYSLAAGPTHLITCDTPNTVEIQPITKVGLTVVSK
jgi:hypothetical protein